MLHADHLRKLIIKPTLTDLNLFSEEISELLMFTCAVESKGGTYLKQLFGPALGIYQMEPKTYNDIWQNYISKKLNLNLMMGIHFNAYTMIDELTLIYDLRFATAMAALHYNRIDMPLPDANDPEALWAFYKKYYNTVQGSANKDKAIFDYQQFVK